MNTDITPRAIHMPAVPAQPELFVLALTRDEAQFLANVMAKIGGCPQHSSRRHAASISDILREGGMRFKYRSQDPSTGGITGTLLCETL